MSWLRRRLALAGLAGLVAALALLVQPSPTPARANVACDAITGAGGAVSGGVEAITGLVGAGNPVSDACDHLTGKAAGAITSPLTGALKGIGNGIFDQITTWVSEGTIWLIEEVATEIEKTTTPDLSAKGFLAEYAQMAKIAAVFAAAMLLLAILEAVAQGSWELLARAVLVNLPVAFIATSVAFAVVQLLLVATDSMSHAIAAATHGHSQHFFKSAISGLSKAGGSVGIAASPGDPASQAVSGTAGAAAAPLFVTFLVAIIGAFAAGAVWIELLMRDASIYVVALFLPMSLAAWIWPRWSGALRRTGELLVVLIASKFLTVSIIALAAGIAAENDGGIEPMLAASALMLVACFAPFLLFKLVPFAEGAMNAAYGRRSAAGGALSGMQIASEVQILRNMARSNWGAALPEVWNVGGGGGSSAGGGGGNGRPGGGQPSGDGNPGAAKGGAGTAKVPVAGAAAAAGASSAAPAGAGATSPATAGAAAPIAAGQRAKSGARRLEQSGAAKAASQGSGQPSGANAGKPSPAAGGSSGGEASAQSAKPTTSSPAEAPPRPPQELGTKGKAKGDK